MRDIAIKAWASANIDIRAISEAQAYDLAHRIDERASRQMVPLYAWLRTHATDADSARISVAISYDGAVRPGIDLTLEDGAVRIAICPWAEGRILAIVTDAFQDWVRQLSRVPLLTEAQRREMVLEFVGAHPRCTVREVIAALGGKGMARITVSRCIRSLIGDGVLDVHVARNPLGGGSRHELTIHEEST